MRYLYLLVFIFGCGGEKPVSKSKDKKEECIALARKESGKNQVTKHVEKTCKSSPAWAAAIVSNYEDCRVELARGTGSIKGSWLCASMAAGDLGSGHCK